MNRVRFLIIFPLVMIGVFSGCSKAKNSAPAATPVAKVTTAATAPSTAVSQNCAAPSVFTVDTHAQSIDVSQLSKMSGTFQLTAANLYSQASDSINSLSAGVTVKLNTQGVRDTKIQNLCNHSSGNGYAETLPVVMTLHLPSLRITQFDIGDGQDLPASNNPTSASLVSNTEGNINFKMTFSDNGPPYAAGLALTDWMLKLPAEPSISLLADGSIEMRIHWNEKNIATDGYLHFVQQK